jgi:predicted alpha-1,6-mannanase (GH76 family)
LFPNTFVNAQKYNLQMQKVVGAYDLPLTYYGGTNQWPPFPPNWPRPPVIETNGFLDGYYDDEGWWALAWIAVYDVTHEPQYLSTAESIFSNMAAAYNTTPCGGLWWDKSHTYVNAIANELFLDVAAHLANRAPVRSKYYLDYALREWTWFQKSGMINAQHTINDGLNLATCRNNGGTVWSYNQGMYSRVNHGNGTQLTRAGVILGGLTELSRATSDASYIATAKVIADAAIHALTDANGILHDVCEPNCGADGSQFKGVFARNLQILQLASPETRFKTFLDTNANSIWANDRNARNELNLVWSGPLVQQPANASTQSSALDALVASLAT